jgi:hypothetical protein
MQTRFIFFNPFPQFFIKMSQYPAKDAGYIVWFRVVPWCMVPGCKCFLSWFILKSDMGVDVNLVSRNGFVGQSYSVEDNLMLFIKNGVNMFSVIFIIV